MITRARMICGLQSNLPHYLYKRRDSVIRGILVRCFWHSAGETTVAYVSEIVNSYNHNTSEGKRVVAHP
jgi:hypothetical protein